MALNYLGPYIPENTLQDTSQFETTPQTGLFQGARISAMDTVHNSPVADFLSSSRLELTKHFSPGKFLSEKEWRDSEFFRTGLSFPKGVSANVAKLSADRIDDEEGRQAQLDNMPSGFLSSGSRLVGNTLGFLLDPVNAAASVLAPEYIGVRAASTLAKVADSGILIKTAARAGVGAAEGAAITAPFALSQFTTDELYGQNPSSLSALSTIAMGAAFGGVVGGAFGERAIMPHLYNKTAMQTAAGQLASGKSVDVGDILQQGYHEGRVQEDSIPREKVEQQKNILKERMSKNESELRDQTEQLNKEITNKEFNDKVSGKPIQPDSPKTSDIIKKTSAILDKPGFERTASERVFLKSVPKTDEIEKALGIYRRPGFDRNSSERVFLQQMFSGDEKNILSERLDRHNTEIENLNEEKKTLTNTSIDKKRSSEIDDQVSGINNKVDIGTVRLNDVRGVKVETPRIKEIRKNIESIGAEQTEIKTAVQHHDAALLMDDNRGEAVNFQQIKSSSDTVASWRGDSVVDEGKEKQFQDEIDDTARTTEELDDKLDKDIQRLRDADLLSDEDMDALDEIKEQEDKLGRFSQVLDTAAKCLVENP